ncbi:MAG: hypothetical protein D3910_16355, partial [Candidatus Electrothrix sp. ATG2]|nr:hypothetical protein [Candidatus Electrothrix sp. ATG2]
SGWLTSRPDKFSFFVVPARRAGMGVYMKVPGNSLELPDKLSSFVVSPPKGGEMGVYMKASGNSLELPDQLSLFVVSPPRGG